MEAKTTRTEMLFVANYLEGHVLTEPWDFGPSDSTFPQQGENWSNKLDSYTQLPRGSMSPRWRVVTLYCKLPNTSMITE